MINVIPKKIDIRICPQWQIMKFYLFWRLYYSEMLSLMPDGWHQLPRRVASSFFGECDIVQTSSKHNKIKYWLVVLTILKTMKVNGKDDIPYIMENKKCLKPPTRIYIWLCIKEHPKIWTGSTHHYVRFGFHFPVLGVAIQMDKWYEFVNFKQNR